MNVKESNENNGVEYYQNLVGEKFVEVTDFGKVGKGKTNFGVDYIEVFEYESVETNHRFYEVEHNSCNEITYNQNELIKNNEIDVNNMLDNFDNERLESDTVEETKTFGTKKELDEYLENQSGKLYDTLSECIKDTEWVKEKVKELEE